MVYIRPTRHNQTCSEHELMCMSFIVWNMTGRIARVNTTVFDSDNLDRLDSTARQFSRHSLSTRSPGRPSLPTTSLRTFSLQNDKNHYRAKINTRYAYSRTWFTESFLSSIVHDEELLFRLLSATYHASCLL